MKPVILFLAACALALMGCLDRDSVDGRDPSPATTTFVGAELSSPPAIPIPAPVAADGGVPVDGSPPIDTAPPVDAARPTDARPPRDARPLPEDGMPPSHPLVSSL